MTDVEDRPAPRQPGSRPADAFLQEVNPRLTAIRAAPTTTESVSSRSERTRTTRTRAIATLSGALAFTRSRRFNSLAHHESVVGR
jgi:hypothetical protein